MNLGLPRKQMVLILVYCAWHNHFWLPPVSMFIYGAKPGSCTYWSSSFWPQIDLISRFKHQMHHIFTYGTFGLIILDFIVWKKELLAKYVTGSNSSDRPPRSKVRGSRLSLWSVTGLSLRRATTKGEVFGSHPHFLPPFHVLNVLCW